MRVLILSLTVLGAGQLPLPAQFPIITNQPVTQAIWAGGNVTFTVGVSNAGSIVYQWQLNGTNLPHGLITTVAGGGVGDGGRATNASVNEPFGVAVNSSGILYFADNYNNRVRKVDTNGIVTTVAGNGISGYSGDGGPAVNACLDFTMPYIEFPGAGLAVDAAGNLFIADSGNQVIRKVDTNGIITTVAGGGNNYPGDGGPATDTALAHPAGVAVDNSGNLYIADTWHDGILKVDISGIVTTIAGNGTRGYSGDGGPATEATLRLPSTMVVDGSGNVCIADFGNSRIRKIDSSGIITTIAGNGTAAYSGDGGPATNASLSSACGVGLDSAGNLFIADSGNNRVRRIDSSTGIITLLAGQGTGTYSGDGGFATNAGLSFPSSVAADSSGNVFISDTYNARVRRVGPNGIITTLAGNGTRAYCGDHAAAVNASLSNPSGVGVDGSGNCYIADTDNSVIRKVGAYGIITTVAGNGTYGFAGDRGPAINAMLSKPYGLGVDSWGNLFIADHDNNRIRKVDTNGIISTMAGTGAYGYFGDGGAATNARLAYPCGAAADAAGNLFIADWGGNRIRKINTNGIITTVAGNFAQMYSGDGGPATNASLHGAFGVALNLAGEVFIGDEFNMRIRKVDTNGIITTVAGDGGFGYAGDGGPAVNARLQDPHGVAVDGSGNLLIADCFNHRIRQVNNNGIISTLAGNGLSAYSGDAGPGTNASLTYPSGVTADVYGNVFIADSGNQRIRKITNTQGPTLTLNNVGAANAGNYQVVVTGPDGSVTSSVANLIVTTSPLIYKTIPNSDGSVTLSFVSQPNSTNVVICTTNLSPPVLWQPLSTNMAGADGDWQFTDPNAVSYQSRFYRSLTQ